jgi:glycosyltransferase involved in cell wall biosynthesis
MAGGCYTIAHGRQLLAKMTRVMRVLHVESGMHLYGGARQVLYLMEGLHDEVQNVLLCAANSEVAAAAQAQGERLRTLPMAGDLDPLLWWRLLRVIREERPDLVHLHSRRGADTQGAIAAWLARVPSVLSRRVDHAPVPLLVGLRYALYDRVIAISEEIRRVLLQAGVPAEKVVCVPSAADLRAVEQPVSHDALCEALELPPDSIVIGVVAQLIERKGHSYLLRAFADIAAALPKARLVFFGRGPLADSLRAQAAALNVIERVVLAGFRTDMAKLMGAIDLVVHPATAEGLGVALLEAAAARRPIVASAVGGIPEIVHNGESGLLVPPRDVNALATAVLRVLRDPELAQRLGEGARARVVARHSVPAMAAGNLAVYRAVLGSEPDPDRGQSML